MSPSQRTYLAPRGRTLEWITRIHRGLYRATGGVLGGTLVVRSEQGTRFPLRRMPVLLLTTTGRKSGTPRTVPLPYFQHGERTFLIASFAGGDKHPAWFLNLSDQPEVRVQLGRRERARRAVALVGPDREAIWAALTASWPRYAQYQGMTMREIPVVELRDP